MNPIPVAQYPELTVTSRPMPPPQTAQAPVWNVPRGPPPRTTAPGGALRRPKGPLPLAADRTRPPPPATGDRSAAKRAAMPQRPAPRFDEAKQRSMLRAYRRHAPQEIALGEGMEGSGPINIDWPQQGDERQMVSFTVKDLRERVTQTVARVAKYYRMDQTPTTLWKKPMDPDKAPEINRRKNRSFVVTMINVGLLHTEIAGATLAALLGQQPSTVVRLGEKELAKEDLLAKDTREYRAAKLVAHQARGSIIDNASRNLAWNSQLQYFRVTPEFDWADVLHSDGYYMLKNNHRWEVHVSGIEEIVIGTAKIKLGIQLAYERKGFLDWAPFNRRWKDEDILMKKKITIFRDRPDRPRAREAEYDPMSHEIVYHPADEANF